MSEKTIQIQKSKKINGFHGVLPIVFPIAGKSYNLRNNWHVKRSKKRYSFDHSFNNDKRAHNGVDIGAKLGMPLYSCVNGIVIAAPAKDFPFDRYGNSIWIQSTQEDVSYGYRFLYAHLDGVHVTVGNQIKTTTQIGTLGMTGNAIRPHLHFEIHYPSGHRFHCNKCKPVHKNVAAINPYPSLYESRGRLKNEIDLAAEKRSVSLMIVGNTIKKLFDRIKPNNV